MLEPEKQKKKKSPYDPPTEDEEEQELAPEVSNIKLNMNKNNTTEIMEENKKQNEFQANKSLQLVFLRKFIAIYFGQILFVGLCLLSTLNLTFNTWLTKNSWFFFLGIAIFILLIIPILFGISKLTWPSYLLMVFILISLFMVFSYIFAVIGNPFGILCYFSLVFSLLTMLIYTLIVTEFNFLICFAVSMVIPTVFQFSWSIYSNTHWTLSICCIFVIAFYIMTISYASYLHITIWLEGGAYKDHEVVHPALRLHYDFFMLFLNMIRNK